MSQPEMIPVDSSNLLQIGYDANTQELHVEFMDGGRYVYQDVPESTFDELAQADSKGSYLNREIKPNYGFRRD